jgi:hypothetical protein
MRKTGLESSEIEIVKTKAFFADFEIEIITGTWQRKRKEQSRLKGGINS